MPTNILKARGSWRGEVNKQEPKPALELPSMPSWLTAEAKAEWRRIVPELSRAGVLTRLDRTVLALYCQAYADYVCSLELMKKPYPTTPIVVTKNKNWIQNPALAVKNQAFKTLLNISAEFGLSPSARARIQAEQKPAGKAGSRKASPFKVA